MNVPQTKILATKRLPNGNLQVFVPIQLSGNHSGSGLRIIVPASDRLDKGRETFLRAVARGRRWQTLIDEESVKDMKEIAEKVGVDISYVARMIRLANISPAIIEKVISGQLPKGISIESVKGSMPLLWEKQEKMLL